MIKRLQKAKTSKNLGAFGDKPPGSPPECKVYSGGIDGASPSSSAEVMEPSPQPRKRMKRSKETPNAAERFQADHQAEYERYEAKSGRNDSARHVDRHNEAYPKMRDELDKRRSTAKATVATAAIAKGIKAANQIYFDPNCRYCQRSRMALEAKNRTLRTKQRSDGKRKTEKRSRVSKPKKPQRKAKSTFGLAKIRTNKGCQYYSQYTNKGTSAHRISHGEETTPRMADEGMTSELIYFSNLNATEQQRNRNSQTVTNPSLSQNGSKSDVVSRNPDTSVNSLSSYNSNMSLDHEPMVSR